MSAAPDPGARLAPLTILLVCLCSWSLPLLTDPMLPVLPVLRAAFAAPLPRVQLVFSLALAAFAVSQAFMGMFADRYGRKPVLLAGFALYVAAGLAALRASTIDALILCRVVQSVGAAAGPVLARAIVRDLLPPARAARAFSLLGFGMALVPLFAPALAARLVAEHGWPGVFGLFVAFGMLIAAFVAFGYRETLPAPDPTALHPARLWAALQEMLAAPERRTALAVIACGYSTIVVYMSTAPFVLQQTYGIEPVRLGWWVTLSFCGFPAGSLLSLWLVQGLSPVALRRGALVMAWAGVAQWLLAGRGLVAHPLAFVLPMTCLTLGWGVVQQQVQAIVLGIHPTLIGRGSALLGVVQLGVGGGVAWVASHYADGSPAPTALVSALGTAALFALALATVRFSPRVGARAR